MNLLDAFASADDSGSGDLRDLRLSHEPAMVLPFTTDTELVALHFVDDDELRSYVVCPGRGRCPICHTGAAPQTFHLLPVYNVESQAVEVLRVSAKRGPGSLGPALRRFLADPDVATMVLLISRQGSRYSVETRPLAADADRGETAVAAFMRDLEAGVCLASAYLHLPPDELASVPRIRRKLDAMGGFVPAPDAPAPKGDEGVDGDA